MVLALKREGWKVLQIPGSRSPAWPRRGAWGAAERKEEHRKLTFYSANAQYRSQ